MGSGELIRTLVPLGLIDELLLFVHPIVLGAGQRMFGESDDVRSLRLRSCSPTASGVVVSAYGRGTSQFTVDADRTVGGNG